MTQVAAEFFRLGVERVNTRLQQLFNHENSTQTRLFEAMRYSTMMGGKRIRPLLVYAAAQTIGSINHATDDAAAAVELIHAYSLIHDDLPAMDDDDLRRGQPTCHKAFDEATAILAGDALQALAFEVLAKSDSLDPAKRLTMIQILALAAGREGMVGGQMMDVEATGKPIALERLEAMHRLKTGAMIRASILLGAHSSASSTTATTDWEPSLTQFADAIGLAFQVRDDILDYSSTTAVLGKRQGADQSLQKSTYISLLGLDQSNAALQSLYTSAIESLAGFGAQADPLRWIAAQIVKRDF